MSVKLNQDAHIIDVLRNFYAMGKTIVLSDDKPIQIIHSEHSIVAKYKPTIKLGTNGDKAIHDFIKFVTVYTKGFIDPSVEFKDNHIEITETANTQAKTQASYLYANSELKLDVIPETSVESDDYIEVDFPSSDISRLKDIANAMALSDVSINYDNNGTLSIVVERKKKNNSRNVSSNNAEYAYKVSNSAGDIGSFSEGVGVHVMFDYLLKDDYKLRIKNHKHRDGRYHPIMVWIGVNTGVEYFIPFKPKKGEH